MSGFGFVTPRQGLRDPLLTRLFHQAGFFSLPYPRKRRIPLWLRLERIQVLVSALCGFILTVFGDTSLSNPHFWRGIGFADRGSHRWFKKGFPTTCSPLVPHGQDTERGIIVRGG